MLLKERFHKACKQRRWELPSHLHDELHACLDKAIRDSRKRPHHGQGHLDIRAQQCSYELWAAVRIYALQEKAKAVFEGGLCEKLFEDLLLDSINPVFVVSSMASPHRVSQLKKYLAASIWQSCLPPIQS